MPKQKGSKKKSLHKRKPYDAEGHERASIHKDPNEEPRPMTRGKIQTRHKLEWRQLRDRLREMDQDKKMITSATPELKRLKRV